MLVALTFRVYRLPELPGPLFGDEAQNGVDALGVIDGIRPIFFAANNGREPLHIYLQAVSGTSESSERTRQLLRQAHKNSTVQGRTSPYTFLEQINALAEYALVHYEADPSRKPN